MQSIVTGAVTGIATGRVAGLFTGFLKGYLTGCFRGHLADYRSKSDTPALHHRYTSTQRAKTTMQLPARPWLLTSFSLLPLLGSADLHSAAATQPRLKSIRAVTITSSAPGKSAKSYIRHLGYQFVEAGIVEAPQAASWEALNLTGRRQIVLRSPDEDSVFLRFVESKASPNYRPLNSSGWSALELLTNDPYQLQKDLRDSPFLELAGPSPLTEGSSIHAMQYLGPDGEVIYLTADLGDGEISTLARTKHPVGRPFIVVAAGSKLDTLSEFYREHFALQESFRLQLPIPFMARAQSITTTHAYSLSLLRLAKFSHSIELDEYPLAPPRPTLAGELPAGIAIVSFCGALSSPSPSPAAASAQAWSLASEVAFPAGEIYAGLAVTVLRGAGGELIEIIDC